MDLYPYVIEYASYSLSFCLSLSLVMADEDRKIFARPDVVANRLAARLERDQRVKTRNVLNASHLDEHWQ